MRCRRGDALVLLLVCLGAFALLNHPLFRQQLLDPSRPPLTKELCQRQNGGKAWPGNSANDAVKSWLGALGPVMAIPDKAVDITSVNTLAQLLAPGLKLVLDPMMYLQTQPKQEEATMPQLIHMTMKDKRKIQPHQVLSILSWGKLNPGYTLLLYDNDDMISYMRKFAPKFMPTYHRLTTPVERSDAWRYHALCLHGGVYADTDTICARPVNSWLRHHPELANSSLLDTGLIVGVENRFVSQQAAEEASYVRKVQMVQWTMAARRSHPVVCSMGPAIEAFMNKEEVEQLNLDAKMGHDASILLRTGPGIWSDAVGGYLATTGGSLDELVAGGQHSDLVVLPQLAFGCNIRFWSASSPSSFVYHMYSNSWKKDHFKVADAKKAQRKATRRAQLQDKLLLPGVVLVVGGGAALLVQLVRWRRSGVLVRALGPWVAAALGPGRQRGPQYGDKLV